MLDARAERKRLTRLLSILVNISFAWSFKNLIDFARASVRSASAYPSFCASTMAGSNWSVSAFVARTNDPTVFGAVLSPIAFRPGTVISRKFCTSTTTA